MKNLFIISLILLSLQLKAEASKDSLANKKTLAFNDTLFAGDALENAAIHLTTSFCIGVGMAIAAPVMLFLAVPAGVVLIIAEGAIILSGAFSISTLVKLARAGKLLKKREIELYNLQHH